MKQDNELLSTEYCNLLHEWNMAYADYAKSIGFSYTSLSVMGMIHCMPNCTQKEIADNCFLPKQTVNSIITSFLKNGWVKLEEVPEDRRNKTVNLTEAGLAKANEILKQVNDSELQALKMLTAEQQETLLELTRTYINSCKKTLAEAVKRQTK